MKSETRRRFLLVAALGRRAPSIMDATTRYNLPSTLTSRQRAAVHAAATAANVGHTSTGEGTTRSLSLGCLTDPAHTVAVACDGDSDDAMLAALAETVGDAFADAVSVALATPKPASGNGASGRINTADAATYAAGVLPLLTAERDAEVAAARSALAAGGRGGHRLAPLRIDSMETGLMGRTMVRLVSAKGGGGGGGGNKKGSDHPPLPAHRFGPHDLVELRPSKAPPSDPPLASGIVSRLTDDAVTVACDEAPDVDADAGTASFRLDRLANDVTHRRLTAAVDDLVAVASARDGPGAGVVGVLFGGEAADAAPLRAPLVPFNQGLDPSQRAAVEAALGAQRVALVHGPPGEKRVGEGGQKRESETKARTHPHPPLLQAPAKPPPSWKLYASWWPAATASC